MLLDPGTTYGMHAAQPLSRPGPARRFADSLLCASTGSNGTRSLSSIWPKGTTT